MFVCVSLDALGSITPPLADKPHCFCWCFYFCCCCGRLCAPNDKPPYLCILIAPASRYIFHSFPIEETEADKAFMHVLEGIVMAVVTEGMGMIDEVRCACVVPYSVP